MCTIHAQHTYTIHSQLTCAPWHDVPLFKMQTNVRNTPTTNKYSNTLFTLNICKQMCTIHPQPTNMQIHSSLSSWTHAKKCAKCAHKTCAQCTHNKQMCGTWYALITNLPVKVNICTTYDTLSESTSLNVHNTHTINQCAQYAHLKANVNKCAQNTNKKEMCTIHSQ